MALVAGSMGLPLSSIVLEEEAHSTHANALFAAKIVMRLVPADARDGLEASVVSERDHLTWALPLFQKVGKEKGLRCFEKAAAIGAAVERSEVIAQMEEF